MGGEARPPRALDVQAPERVAHERAAEVVAEADLVLERRQSVARYVGIGQLPESIAAQQADDLVLPDGEPGIALEIADPGTPIHRPFAIPDELKGQPVIRHCARSDPPPPGAA